MIDRTKSKTMYRQLADILGEQIKRREFEAGDRLPTVREMERLYKVSLPVVRQALNELERDGMVTVVHGRGTFVTEGALLPMSRKSPDAEALLAPSNAPRASRAGGAGRSKATIAPVLFCIFGHLASDPFYSRVLHGVQQEASRQGLQVVYAEHTAERPVSALLNETAFCGVILSGGVEADHIGGVVGRGLACVVAGDVQGWSSLPPGLTNVVNDDFDGGYQVGRHLIEHGHRRLGVITCRLPFAFWRLRVEGFRQACAEAGIAAEDLLVMEVSSQESRSGEEAARALMDLDVPPSAIFACNDRLAYGVYACLQKDGRRVPDDCSVVGFDDLALSADLSPGLSTVHLHIESMGERAVESLLAQANAVAVRRERIMLPVSVRERGSVATCPQSVAAN